MTCLLRGRADHLLVHAMHAYIPWVFVMTRRLDLAVGYLLTWYITLHSWASVRMWTVDSGDVQLYTAFLFSSLQFPSCPSMTPPWRERNGIGAVDKHCSYNTTDHIY
jgi:hypothetical protein